MMLPFESVLTAVSKKRSSSGASFVVESTRNSNVEESGKCVARALAREVKFSVDQTSPQPTVAASTRILRRFISSDCSRNVVACPTAQIALARALYGHWMLDVTVQLSYRKMAIL
jgi:hypothetical protein